ncbi:MAG: GntR family transcriptional regulator protein [Pseudomonas sp.]|jgi:DNA-binding FadR family transcriptional regulator|uniref:FadR/GntR family transcriptional regulator n=1 Tax=Pseudomonas sp. TaxID=306 RepID=UPI00260E4F6B|nr:FadR/GntR family transcriptional regulator [Pseudomonas sp.]MDB6052326.1 GntR family transcriptional regulator protein [Pseudomonas sp.]
MTHAQTFSNLQAYIREEDFSPGDRLPPERDLALRLGIARTALRRQLSQLENQGILIRQVGRGTFIAYGASAALCADTPLISHMATTYPGEVLETRLILEPQIARLAAQRANASDIESLQQAIQKGRDADSYETFEKWDATFHRVLVQAARNGLLTALYQSIDAVRAGKIWGRLKESSLSPESMQVYIRGHEAIVEAIIDRDSARAEREMRSHINVATYNLLGSSG